MDATHAPGSAPATPASVAPVAPYYPGLACHVHDLGPVRGVRCVTCCHWTFPFSLQARTIHGPGSPAPFSVPMTYPEWLVYHWHIVLHQAGCPVLPA